MKDTITFSDHALDKIEILKKHGITLTKESVIDVVSNPQRIDEGYAGRMVAQKEHDADHVIRVVYEKESGNMKIITMYPGRKTRYEKNQI